MGSIYLRKYGVATTVDFCLYKLDGTGLKTDAVSASGDVTLYRDEAAVETLDADAFVDEGAIYSLALSAAEMTAARIIVCVVDQSGPQVWLDKTLIVETYGDASAQHAFDLDTVTQNVNVASSDNIDFGALQKASITAAVPTVDAIADGVWDEVITTAIHANANSGGYLLRRLHQTLVSKIDQATAGAAGSITLAAGDSAVNDFYKGQIITIIAGTGIGQSRACYGYTGATKVALIRPDWATTPDNTSWYGIVNFGSAVIAALENIDLSATMKASVNAECDTAVTDSGIKADTAAIKAITDLLTLAAIADTVHDEAVEGAITERQALRLVLAVLTGKTSEAVAGTMVIRDANDTADRATFTMDANRYRTGTVLNP